MSFSKDKRKEMLLESFNVLKENVIENSSKIGDLLDMCFLLDEQLATDMWGHLIDSNISRIGQSGYSFSCRLLHLIMDCSGNHINKSKFSYIMYNNNKICDAIFNLSDELGSSNRVVSQLIADNKVDKANHLLELVYTNNNKSISFSQYLEDVFQYLPYPHDNPISTAAAEMLSNWIDKITDKSEKAQLNIAFLTKIAD
jgi:hypothetical protein